MIELKEGSFKNLFPLILEVIKKGLTPFIWGPPGLGKSALTRMVALELKKSFLTLDAPLFQPTDYAIPVPDRDKKTIELYKTGFIPFQGEHLVSIEDLPHAKGFQQVPLLQIILDRRVANYPIAPEVSFIATGNRAEDNAYTHPIASPLLNRFIHFYMKPEASEWVELYAKPNKLDERVILFNQSFHEHHYSAPAEGVNAFPTPRSWEFFSKLIKDLDTEHEASNDAVLDKMRSFALASVGETASAAFMTWYKHLRAIDAKSIVIKGVFPELKGSDRPRMFALILAVGSYVSRMSSSELTKYAKNILNLLGALEDDYKVTFLRHVFKVDPKTGSYDTKVLAIMSAEPSFHHHAMSLGSLLPLSSKKSFEAAA